MTDMCVCGHERHFHAWLLKRRKPCSVYLAGGVPCGCRDFTPEEAA